MRKIVLSMDYSLHCIYVNGQNASGFNHTSFVDSVALEALKSGPVSGLSIAIMQHDKLLHAKGYGYANLEHNVPATI